MKKITFLLAILAVSLGHAQLLPFTFTDGGSPTQHSIVGDSGGAPGTVTVVNTTDPDDASNDVLSITGNGSSWDNAQVDFANNIDLSDDMNNTITFRFKNTVNDGVHTHALKFENGTTADTELTFTTEDDQWKNISLDFPAGLGNYGRMVIFTDFGNGNTATGTYLIDDIAGATHLTVTPMFILPVDFSDEVNDAMNAGDGAGVSIITDPDDAGNKVLEIVGNGTDWDNAQVVFPNPLDLSDDANNTMRFRMRSTTAGPAEVNEHLIKFELPTAGGDTQVTFTTTGTAWTDVEADFGPGLSSYGRLVIMTDWGGGATPANADTYLVDDIMAPGATVLSVNDFKALEFSAYPNPTQDNWTIKSKDQRITSVKVYDILGKQVLSISPNSREVRVDGSDLNIGLYFAQIKTDNSVDSVKLVKK